jgi:hypothetical protein
MVRARCTRDDRQFSIGSGRLERRNTLLPDGVPPRPYISDRGALTYVYDNVACLSNSEPTELIFLQSCQLILT